MLNTPRHRKQSFATLEPTSPPPYTSTVSRRARFLLKREFDNPVRPSFRTRQWQRVDAELCGTILHLTTSPTSTTSTSTKGRRIVRLSLLGGDAGLARDYGKRSNVLRLRVEGRQFLLAAESLSVALDWIEALHAAFAIAPPLEYRCEPQFRSLPYMYAGKRRFGVREKLQKKWREQWRASSRNNLWLTRRSSVPAEGEEMARGDEGSVVGAQGNVLGQASNRWSMMSTATGHSAWTMFSSVDTPAPQDQALSTTSQHPAKPSREDDEAKARYARILLYHSPWKGNWYFREGHIYLCRNPLIKATDSKWI